MPFIWLWKAQHGLVFGLHLSLSLGCPSCMILATPGCASLNSWATSSFINVASSSVSSSSREGTLVMTANLSSSMAICSPFSLQPQIKSLLLVSILFASLGPVTRFLESIGQRTSKPDRRTPVASASRAARPLFLQQFLQVPHCLAAIR